MLKNIAIFAIGLASGACATYVLIKDKYEKYAQEQIDEMRSLKGVSEPKKTFKTNDKPDIHKAMNYSTYYEAVKGYSAEEPKKATPDIPEAVLASREEPEDDNDAVESDDDFSYPLYPKDDILKEPYPITPDEFADSYPYFDKMTLFYHSDGILVDEEGEEVLEPRYLVGEFTKDLIGQYEANVAYIRNEKISKDYEIIWEDEPAYLDD